MAYKCEKHGKLVEEGKEATPPIFWAKVALCPVCIAQGSRYKPTSFKVHKLEVV